VGGSCSTTKTSVGRHPACRVAHQCPVQQALGLTGAASEHRDLDQDEVVAAAGRQLNIAAQQLFLTNNPGHQTTLVVTRKSATVVGCQDP
jgi:hypothetical protein